MQAISSRSYPRTQPPHSVQDVSFRPRKLPVSPVHGTLDLLQSAPTEPTARPATQTQQSGCRRRQRPASGAQPASGRRVTRSSTKLALWMPSRASVQNDMEWQHTLPVAPPRLSFEQSLPPNALDTPHETGLSVVDVTGDPGHALVDLAGCTRLLWAGNPNRQKFSALVDPMALVWMDMHAHACRHEVTGVLGGTFDLDAHKMVIKMALPVYADPQGTGLQDVEMDPKSLLAKVRLPSGRCGVSMGWCPVHDRLQSVYWRGAEG